MKMAMATMVAWSSFALMSSGQTLEKFTFEGSGGVSFPAGSAKDHLNTGYNFLLGAGWKFSPRIAGLLEFQ